MWHASVSAQDERRGPVAVESIVEKQAVKALAGVGGEREWWWYSPGRVGHLRVPVTDDEYARMPPGEALDDAGETGPQRPRTRK